MRWRDDKGDFNLSRKINFSLSASELFYYYYSNAFKGAQPVRMVGHSLGSQMAVALCEHALNHDKSLLPNRLVLLDPFWSKGEKPYLTQGTTADRVLKVVNRVTQTQLIPIELYRSSIIGESKYLVGLQNLPLRKLAAYSKIKPSWEGMLNFHGHHVSVFPYYFNSFGINNCKECKGKVQVSAAASGSQILKLMGNSKPFVQIKGQNTFHFKDDVFTLKKE